MLELSRRGETIMIVIGLAAGSIACLLCIVWTCVLFARHKDDRWLMMGDDGRRPPILPTTTEPPPTPPTPKQDKMAERNASLLVALSSVRGEVPLPPPSNLVSPASASAWGKETMRNRSQKRKLDEITVQQQENSQYNQQVDSWKACGLEFFPSRPMKRAIVRTAQCHKPAIAKTYASMSLFDAGEISEQQQQQGQAIDREVSSSTVSVDGNHMSLSSHQTMEFAFSSPRCVRWRPYPKLRRSVSDETCAGTTTATTTTPHEHGSQHI